MPILETLSRAINRKGKKTQTTNESMLAGVIRDTPSLTPTAAQERAKGLQGTLGAGTNPVTGRQTQSRDFGVAMQDARFQRAYATHRPGDSLGFTDRAVAGVKTKADTTLQDPRQAIRENRGTIASQGVKYAGKALGSTLLEEAAPGISIASNIFDAASSFSDFYGVREKQRGADEGLTQSLEGQARQAKIDGAKKVVSAAGSVATVVTGAPVSLATTGANLVASKLLDKSRGKRVAISESHQQASTTTGEEQMEATTRRNERSMDLLSHAKDPSVALHQHVAESPIFNTQRNPRVSKMKHLGNELQHHALSLGNSNPVESTIRPSSVRNQILSERAMMNIQDRQEGARVNRHDMDVRKSTGKTITGRKSYVRVEDS